MAAEALENAGSQMDVEIYVETKGSAGISAIDDAIIATADAAIFAADIGVRGRDRFEHLSIYEVGVKVAINQPFEVINEAIERAKTRVEKQTEILEESDRQSHLSEKSANRASATTSIRQWLMTGMSYAIPAIAVGGACDP
jgi:PTS system fructose-specific IIC component